MAYPLYAPWNAYLDDGYCLQSLKLQLHSVQQISLLSDHVLQYVYKLVDLDINDFFIIEQ